jgi:hypothetical protein
MDKKTTEILDESISQELLVSDIYSLFEKTFREDSEFWYKLSVTALLYKQKETVFMKKGYCQ